MEGNTPGTHWELLSSKASKVLSPQRRWQGGGITSPFGSLVLSHCPLETLLLGSWGKLSTVKGALGWLFVNAPHSFLTTAFLLFLLTLSLGSAWSPVHSAGVKAFASLCS